jgi:L-threonylcarbamoyladenylate synthase
VNVLSPWRRGQLGLLLDNAGVIAYPTEGVWGLGCLPVSEAAVMHVLDLKKRDWRQGLLLVASGMDQVAPYLEGLTDDEWHVLASAWPGPTTYLVPDNGLAPAWIVGNHDTLGLRVSQHPLVRQLCDWFGPLVSTSANISGHPSATSALEVRRYFGAGIDALVPGQLGGADGASRIVHLESGQVIR